MEKQPHSFNERASSDGTARETDLSRNVELRALQQNDVRSMLGELRGNTPRVTSLVAPIGVGKTDMIKGIVNDYPFILYFDVSLPSDVERLIYLSEKVYSDQEQPPNWIIIDNMDNRHVSVETWKSINDKGMKPFAAYALTDGTYMNMMTLSCTPLQWSAWEIRDACHTWSLDIAPTPEVYKDKVLARLSQLAQADNIGFNRPEIEDILRFLTSDSCVRSIWNSTRSGEPLKMILQELCGSEGNIETLNSMFPDHESDYRHFAKILLETGLIVSTNNPQLNRRTHALHNLLVQTFKA